MLGSQSYIEKSKMAGCDHHGIAAAGLIEKLYTEHETDYLCSAVLDEAGQKFAGQTDRSFAIPTLDDR